MNRRLTMLAAVLVTAGLAAGIANALGAFSGSAPNGGRTGHSAGSGPLCLPGPCTAASSWQAYYVDTPDDVARDNSVRRLMPETVPNNLVLDDPAHKNPLVVYMDGGSNDYNRWREAACSSSLGGNCHGPYVIIQVPDDCRPGGNCHDIPPGSGNFQYADPGMLRAGAYKRNSKTAQLWDCGPNRTSACDDLPEIYHFIKATECIGAPPCANVDPAKVLVEGASRGGLMTEAVMCDTYTSALATAYEPVSAAMGIRNAANADSVVCPALGGHCSLQAWCSGSTNKHLRVLWIYGTAETGSYGPTCPSPKGCLGSGYPNGNDAVVGAEQLAGVAAPLNRQPSPSGKGSLYHLSGLNDWTNTGRPVGVIASWLGCPIAPSQTTTFGNTADSPNRLTYRGHYPCSSNSWAETATIAANNGPHVPSGWNGLSIPAEGMRFLNQEPMP